jgi:hypothetical protein
MFKHQKDGPRQAFLSGPPGSHIFQRNIGVTLYYRKKEVDICCILLRKIGPRHLRNMPLPEIWSLLADFVSENFYSILHETFFRNFCGPYFDNISESSFEEFCQRFSESRILCAEERVYLIPLVPICISTSFDSKFFFLSRPDDLSISTFRLPIQSSDFNPLVYPPFKDHQGIHFTPNGWLGIRDANRSSARKVRNAILGAISLKLDRIKRYTFTGRDMFGGWSELHGGYSYNLGSSHTPAVSYDINITSCDHVWMHRISDILNESEKRDVYKIRALEYFYRAWPLPEAERFPILFMALDALFHIESSHTDKFVQTSLSCANGLFSEKQIRLLVRLRGSVIHGGSPDVYDSNKYIEYYEKFENSPTDDIERLSEICLRKLIFDDTFLSTS